MRSPFSIILFLSLIFSNSYSQVPELINYPLVKGVYKSAVKDGNHLFCLTDYGLMIWDVSDLQAPQLISKLPAPGFYVTGLIKKYNNFVIIQRYDTLIIVDVSNVSAPVYAPNNFQTISYSQDLEIKDSVLYVASNDLSGIRAFDIADINNITQIYTGSTPNIEELILTDTNLFAFGEFSFYRFNVNGPIPILIDSIVANPSYFLLDAAANNNIAALAYGDLSNFNHPVSVHIYDISIPGVPILIDSIDVSTHFAIALPGITDSVLFMHSDSLIVFDITNPSSLVATDTLGLYLNKDLLLDDTLIFIMNWQEGFDILAKDLPFSYSLYSECKAGDWFDKIEISESGQVFVRGFDTTFVFHKSRSTSETTGDLTFLNRSPDFALIDNYLIETEIDGHATLRISGLDNFPIFDSIITVSGGGSSNLFNLRIWDNKLYNWEQNSGYEIYDISDTLNPILLSQNVLVQFNHFYDGVLYDIINTNNEVNIYDPAPSPPAYIRLAAVGGDDCPPDGFWDPQRALANFVCYTSREFYQLDFSDTSDIYFTNRVSFPLITVGNWDLVKAWNSILYMPEANQKIYIFDVCDIDHFRMISQFNTENFFKDILLVDSVLYVCYPGYVASYDVSHILPCLYTGIQELDTGNPVELFPNPSDGNFTLQFFASANKVEINIYDVSGRQILTRALDNRKGELIKANLSIGQAGAYLLNIKDGNRTYRKKVIIR